MSAERPTYGQILRRIRCELRVMVNDLNAAEEFDEALAAQQTIVCSESLLGQLITIGLDECELASDVPALDWA